MCWHPARFAVGCRIRQGESMRAQSPAAQKGPAPEMERCRSTTSGANACSACVRSTCANYFRRELRRAETCNARRPSARVVLAIFSLRLSKS